ncbi:MAG: hypothetical protein WD023_06525 [Ilumatobacteraceae bacterium]
MPLWLALAVFVISALAVGRLGAALAQSGDALADRTGLGRVFVGTLLVAVVTSLPEVATDVTAAVAGSPDLAVGDLFGSSMANMAILAIIDLRYRRRVWPLAGLVHARVAAIAILLTALAILGVLTPPGVSLGWVGLDTIMIGGLYVAAVAWFRRMPSLTRPGDPCVQTEAVGLLEPIDLERTPHAPTMRSLVARFALAGLGILIAAPVLSLAAKAIAEASGVDETFLGATLLAITTSLPELVVALAAVRIGAHDLAVGNLFGSNMVNMAVLLLVDLAYVDGPLLAAVDPSQVVAGIGAIVLMALAVAVLVGGSETRIRRLEPDAIVMLVAYVGAIIAIAVT